MAWPNVRSPRTVLALLRVCEERLYPGQYVAQNLLFFDTEIGRYLQSLQDTDGFYRPVNLFCLFLFLNPFLFPRLCPLMFGPNMLGQEQWLLKYRTTILALIFFLHFRFPPILLILPLLFITLYILLLNYELLSLFYPKL